MAERQVADDGPDTPSGVEDIIHAHAALGKMLRMLGGLEGIAPIMGFDADAVTQLAREAAEEEFTTIDGEEGRLQSIGLSDESKEKIIEALSDTYVMALLAGQILRSARDQGLAAGK